MTWVLITMMTVGAAHAGTAYLLGFGSGLKDDPKVNSIANDGDSYSNKFNEVAWFKDDWGVSIQLVDISNTPSTMFSYTPDKMGANFGMLSRESEASSNSQTDCVVGRKEVHFSTRKLR